MVAPMGRRGGIGPVGGIVNCSVFDEAMADFADGSIPPDGRAAFDLHRTACATCRSSFDGYRSTITQVKRAYSTKGTELPSGVSPFVEETSRKILEKLTDLGLIGDDEGLFFG